MKKDIKYKLKKIVPPKKKEEGMFGAEALIMILFFIGIFLLVLFMNYFVANLAWSGVVTEMSPDHLYPDLLKNGLPNAVITVNHGSKSLFYGAMWLQENVVIRYIVNGLLLFIILMVGVAYLYYDLFEQYLNTRLKTFLPRIVFGTVLAYTGTWIIYALFVLAKGAYVLFWNLPPPFNNWQNPFFMTSLAPNVNMPYDFTGLISAIERGYLWMIWLFIIAGEALMLLVLVAIRDYLLAVLIVLLPIASLLLIHPWTQRIGSRLWWLAVDLVFLPIVMIIPLALLGLVHNSISFTIAGVAITIGAIYLIAQEPFVLTGAGFSRAGTMLTAGVAGGQLGGQMVVAQRLGPQTAMGIASRLQGTGMGGMSKLAMPLSQKGGAGGMGMGGGAGGMAGGVLNNAPQVLKGGNKGKG